MEEFRTNLFYLINNSQLSIDAVYYVFKDVYRELDDTYKNYLRQKAAAAQAAQAQAQEGEAAPTVLSEEKVEE